METFALEIQGLKKKYATGVQALKGIDLHIEPGDFYALLGANGAGKTTTIGIVTGLVNKTEGEVKVFGHDIDRETSQARFQVGVVPQEFNFNIFEKVLDIVVQQAGYYGVPRHEAIQRAEELLKALSLWDKRDQASRTLSGGMKRRLMIARALMHKPRLLILDEPTAGVDVELRHGMWDYLRELNKSGTTILLTTHYLEEVEQMCRRVAILKEGEIVKEDSVQNVLHSLDELIYILTLEDGSVREMTFKKGDSLTDMILSLKKEEGLEVIDVKPKGNRLEQLFLDLLKK